MDFVTALDGLPPLNSILIDDPDMCFSFAVACLLAKDFGFLNSYFTSSAVILSMSWSRFFNGLNLVESPLVLILALYLLSSEVSMDRRSSNVPPEFTISIPIFCV